VAAAQQDFLASRKGSSGEAAGVRQRVGLASRAAAAAGEVGEGGEGGHGDERRADTKARGEVSNASSDAARAARCGGTSANGPSGERPEESGPPENTFATYGCIFPRAVAESGGEAAAVEEPVDEEGL
jgi:hypothetical protein